MSQSQFLPDVVATSVLTLDIPALRKQGIKALALDIDSTLVEHGQVHISPEVITFLRDSQLELYLATNRLQRNVDEFVELLGAKGIQYPSPNMRKPSKAYFRKLIRTIGRPANEIAMVGDRLFSDVYGANRVGMLSIWVENLGKDKWYTRLFMIRQIERLIYRGLSK